MVGDEVVGGESGGRGKAGGVVGGAGEWQEVKVVGGGRQEEWWEGQGNGRR